MGRDRGRHRSAGGAKILAPALCLHGPRLLSSFARRLRTEEEAFDDEWERSFDVDMEHIEASEEDAARTDELGK